MQFRFGLVSTYINIAKFGEAINALVCMLGETDWSQWMSVYQTLLPTDLVASWLFLCNWMNEGITRSCAGVHINASFQCLNSTNYLWGAGAGALLGLWNREPSGSLSLEFGAMMRDRISEKFNKAGVKLWQPHFNFKTFSRRIGFLTLQVCSLLMRLLSAGPSGECALPFFR